MKNIETNDFFNKEEIDISNEPSDEQADIRLPRIRTTSVMEKAQKGMIRMHNIIKKGNENKETDSNNKTIFESPSIFLKKPIFSTSKEEKNNAINKEIGFIPLDLDNDFNENEEKKKEIIFEDTVFKFTEKQKMKPYWLALMGKEIYYYKNNQKDTFEGMHNLSGTFIQENGHKVLNYVKYYSFSIIFQNKARNYYCSNKNTAKLWVQKLKEAIGYQNFFDYYEILSDIGEGKFGKVKLGIHKKTGENVAIKIISKNMPMKDKELVRTEINIMKLCRHPNIVRLLDHFENEECIFIVMEYLSGGDLANYLTNCTSMLTEKQIAKIIFQISSGLQYLHDYGIVHRDIKPQNLLYNIGNNGEITVKIMDFGISKIMGNNEKTLGGFGTLCFIAPEVILRKPYDKKIDVWSMGVTIYLLLFGDLPFKSDNGTEETIAKMIVYYDLEISKHIIKRSEELKNLVVKCLVKNPEKRIDLKQIINNETILNLVKN